MKKNLFTILSLTTLMAITGCTTSNNSSSSTNQNDGKYRVIVEYPNGQRAPENISVQWCDDSNCYPANTDNNGVASIDIADGEYDVHLYNLPDGYAYQPGIYVVDENNKEITITLSQVSTPKQGDGTAYDAFFIEEGVYSVTIEPVDAMVYYAFAPTRAGEFKIESWAENIDTSVGYYGNSFYVSETPLNDWADDNSGIDGQNFSLNFNISQDQLGGEFVFGISATGFKSKKKTFHFAITREGDYVREEIIAKTMEVSETLTKYIEPEENFYFNSTDKFYHVNSQNGPVLVAKISAPCAYIDVPFTEIEEAGNRSLTLDNGTKNYTSFIAKYGEYCNSDGVYGVTEEIKQFLQYYFAANEAWVDSIALESQEIIDPEYGWMFACGYYTAGTNEYSSPMSGEGTSDDPYSLINIGEYYADLSTNSTVYYQFYVKNTVAEQVVYVSSKDANAKFVCEGTEYTSENGPYFEITLGGWGNPTGFLLEMTTVDGSQTGFAFELNFK